MLGIIGIQTVRLNHAKSQIVSMQAAEKLAEAQEKAREASAAAISQKASSGLSEAKAQVIVKYRTLVQRVAVANPASLDVACKLPPTWIDLWNAGSAVQ